MDGFFDDIVCVTLKTSYDRHRSAEGVFNSLGIPARFHEADRSPNGGRYGCFDSHVAVIRQAYDKGHHHILIFEDDVIPTKAYSDELLGQAVDFMRSRKDWDIFYLGYIALTYDMSLLTCSKVSPHIVQFNPYATHAYCLSRTGMIRVLSTYEAYINYMHVDHYYANVFGTRAFCIVPMLFSQNFDMTSSVEACNTMEAVLRRYMDMHNDMRPLEHLSNFIYYREVIVFIICVLFILTLILGVYMLNN